MQSFSAAGGIKDQDEGVHHMLRSSDGVRRSVLVLPVREMVMESHLKLERPSACVWAH